jgi:hypothetical protein
VLLVGLADATDPAPYPELDGDVKRDNAAEKPRESTKRGG